MSKLTSPAKFDTNDVSIKAPGKMRNGAGYLCKMETPELQLPRMSLPWDTGVRPGINNGPPNCKLSLKFDGFKDELEGTHGKLAEVLDKLDDMATAFIIDNKKTLFGNKAKSDAVIRETFHRAIKEDPNNKYTPTFSAKVDFDRCQDPKRTRIDDPNNLSQQFSMQLGCFTREGQPLVPEDVLTKDSEIQAVVKPKHIWVTQNGMGITYNASRCVVLKTGGSQNQFDFDLEPEKEGDNVSVPQAEADDAVEFQGDD